MLPLLSLLTLLRNNSKVRDHKLITMLFFVLKVAIYFMPCYFDQGEEGLISFVHVFAIPTYLKKKNYWPPLGHMINYLLPIYSQIVKTARWFS